MRLSIIIPVYQVKNTLERCLDSIVGQSFRDWQAILVDDASTDGSSDICDRYVKRDHRIQVIHLKKNRGLSSARNAGLDKAKGEYITFIDSDDYIAEDTLKMLMETLSVHPDYDMLEYPVMEHFGSPHPHMLQFFTKEYTDMLEYWLRCKAYRHTYAWNKIYRKEVFNQVRFPSGMNFEDSLTLPLILKNCQRVATTGMGLYYYCENPNGITRRATAEDLSCLLLAHVRAIINFERKLSRRKDKKEWEKDMGTYYAHVLNIQFDVYDKSGHFFVKSRNRRKSNIKYRFPILPYRNTFKLKLLHLLGIKRLCSLHRTFKRLS